MLTKKKQTDIQIAQALVRSNKLQFYTIWDVQNKNFKQNKENCYGIWKQKDDIQNYLCIDPNRYKIIDIDLSDKIPDDFRRILELGAEFSDPEKQRMLSMKFRQMLIVFIYRNIELRKQMEELYGR